MDNTQIINIGQTAIHIIKCGGKQLFLLTNLIPIDYQK
jgi:hypothetical protein